MTRYLAVTTCNAEQWERYGRAMVKTYCRHWPAEVPLWNYSERFDPKFPPGHTMCITRWDLDTEAPWLTLFKRLYSAPQFNGGHNGRDYRRDAVRFAHKVAAIGAAAEDADCDVLIWIDADVVTHEPVTVEWLDSLFPAPAEVAWLERDGAYPECGFLMFRMPAALKLIRTVVRAYREGAIFSLPETHDSYVIQHYVRRLGVKTHSLSGPEGRKHIGHPFANSPRLSQCLDHLKGEIRKKLGRTPKEQRHIKDDVAYWR